MNINQERIQSQMNISIKINFIKMSKLEKRHEYYWRPSHKNNLDGFRVIPLVYLSTKVKGNIFLCKKIEIHHWKRGMHDRTKFSIRPLLFSVHMMLRFEHPSYIYTRKQCTLKARDNRACTGVNRSFLAPERDSSS